MSFDRHLYYPGQGLEHFCHPQTCSCVLPRVTKCLRFPKTERSARIVPGKLGQLITLFVYLCSLPSFVSGYRQSAFCHRGLVFPILEFHMNGIMLCVCVCSVSGFFSSTSCFCDLSIFVLPILRVVYPFTCGLAFDLFFVWTVMSKASLFV